MVRRCVFALVLMVLVALGSSTAAPMQVQASQVETWRIIMRTYYSDATYSQVIGRRNIGCDGTIYATGSMSDYYTTEYYPCDL